MCLYGASVACRVFSSKLIYFWLVSWKQYFISVMNCKTVGMCISHIYQKRNKSNLWTVFSKRLGSVIWLYIRCTSRGWREEGRAFCFCFRIHVISLLFCVRCCQPLVLPVTEDPMMSYSVRHQRQRALTGAMQHCFLTCRELVKRRWV